LFNNAFGIKGAISQKSPEHLIFSQMHFKRLIFGSFFLGTILWNHQGYGQFSPYVAKILEYRPAPGQFINSAYGCPWASQSLVGGISGMVSLGGFGGYLVVGFDHSIENHPDNPYGVDFTIFGNANVYSSEPATVYVMKDDNRNQLPDDTWYMLAGSGYYFTSAVHAYEITYVNPNSSVADDVPWADNLGNEGFILDNTFHTQPYYPLKDSFPDISDSQYTLIGMKLQAQVDSTDPAFIVTRPYPFGFADNTPRNTSYQGWEPDNPYTAELEGTGGDGFDISWAVDSEDNSVDLDGIDFIKIQTSVNQQVGWLGELSAEISGVVDVSPNPSITGKTQRLVLEPLFRNLEAGESVKLTTHLFKNGLPDNEAVVQFSVDDETLATVDANGQLQTLQAGKIIVFAKNDERLLADSLELTIQYPVSVASDGVQNIVLYPNPAKDFIHTRFPNAIEAVRITSMMGQTWELASENGTDYRLPQVGRGIYVVSYRVNQQWKSNKLIINP